MKVLLFAVSMFLALVRADIGVAQITVNGAIFHLKFGDRPVQNVTVGNSSPDPFYVQVTVDEILDPADGGAKMQPSTDLLASPKSFSIQGNGTRTVRLLRKAPPGESERVYRVAFAPQDRGLGDQVDLSGGARKAMIRVLTGMGILVYADPINPHAELSWERTKDSLIFKNSGNVHVQISSGKSCTPGTTICKELPGKRIYAQRSFEVKVPASELVKYVKKDVKSGDFQEIIIEPQ